MYTNEEIICEIRRELRMRQSLSERGDLDRAEAARRIGIMEEILEHYLARTSGLAEQAIFNWENSERTKFANQLQTGTAAEIGLKGKNHAR